MGIFKSWSCIYLNIFLLHTNNGGNTKNEYLKRNFKVFYQNFYFKTNSLLWALAISLKQRELFTKFSKHIHR